MCGKWDKHLAYLDRQLEVVCPAAGEEIHATIDGVKGVYLSYPEAGRRVLHKDELALSFVGPTSGRHYRFVEIGERRNKIVRHELTSLKQGDRRILVSVDRNEVSEAQAEFELRSSTLTDKNSQAQGLHGDRTEIVHRKSGQLIARRTSYYYLLDSRLTSFLGQRLEALDKRLRSRQIFVPCENYSPVDGDQDTLFRWSDYDFSRRVLKPAGYSFEESQVLFALNIGGGVNNRDCDKDVLFGPGIGLHNLTVDVDTTSGDAVELFRSRIRFGVQGHRDEMHCNYTDLVYPNRREPKFMFYDGSRMQSADLLEHFGLESEFKPDPMR